ARAHAARPRVAGITTSAAHDDAEPGARTLPPTGVDPRALGTLVHLSFEHCGLEPAALRARLAARARTLDCLDARAVVDEALALLESPGGAALRARLRELDAHVLGREVPLLAPPLQRDGPTLARTGQIDLLYRDPADGVLVVADYKTDRDVDARGARERHGAQVAAYASALSEALAAPVRAELWMVRSGEIVGLG
ncbi:MAG: hypothetical protein FJ299_11350, partial [Planctomycetes bacterium]|nr:hypothetical protein [Planctomycetota bacterium]